MQRTSFLSIVLVLLIISSGCLDAGNLDQKQETPQTESSDGIDETGKNERVSDSNPSIEKNNSTNGNYVNNTSKEAVQTRPESNFNLSEENAPTEKRYVNVHNSSAPNWVPEESLSINQSNIPTYEVTRYPDSRPTSEQLESSWELYRKSYKAAEERGWFDYEEGLEDGYVQTDRHHYANVSYLLNEDNLDPYRPETLVYYDHPKKEEDKILAGYMYYVDSLDTEGEQVGGPLTQWHYHTIVVEASRMWEEERIHEWHNNQVSEGRTYEMIHVWFIKHPEGPFATSMSITGDLWDNDMMSESEFKRYAMESYNNYRTKESE